MEDESPVHNALWMQSREISRPGIQVDVENLCYSSVNQNKNILEKKQILFDVCFKMVPGTLTAIMGPSGSGKR